MFITSMDDNSGEGPRTSTTNSLYRKSYSWLGMGEEMGYIGEVGVLLGMGRVR